MKGHFLDFHILEKKKYIDYWEEAGLEGEAVDLLKKQWETEFEPQYKRVLANYPRRTYWSGQNLKEMAAHDPELLKMYCMLYPYVSGFAHGGSPLALASYVDFNENAPVKSLAAPSDAEPYVLDAVHFVASRPGGHGAVREIIEFLLRSRGSWDAVTGKYFSEGAVR